MARQVALGRKAVLGLGQARLVAGPVHEIGRILAVVNGELRVESDARRIFAQQARANGVESAGVLGRRRRRGLGRQTAGEQALDPADQFGRRAARESRQHDALRIGAGEDQRRHPMGEHRRLAGAGAGDDEQRRKPFRRADPMLDREALLGVKLDRGRLANQGERHARNATTFRALFARASTVRGRLA